MPAIKIADITNLSAEGARDRYSLSFEAGGARYHCWVDSDYNVQTDSTGHKGKRVLYKNPPINTAKRLGDYSRNPAHFDTRYLDLDSATWAPVRDHILTTAKADNLISKANKATMDAEAKRIADGIEQDGEHARGALLKMAEVMREDKIGDPDALLAAVAECPNASLAKLTRYFATRTA